MTRQEIGLHERAWVNYMILVDMLERETLHKEYLDEQNPILRLEKLQV